MSRILLHPSGKSVECAPGDTVLMALERAGYALPSNCRAGACGECKVKVTAGQFDQGMVLDMALRREERRQGYGLMCMAKPISDELVIEWGTADARPRLFPPREQLPFVITERQALTPRVVQLHLRPVDQLLRYWPGQYVTLGQPAADIPARAYSIANAPRPDGELVLQVSRSSGGLTSPWICDQLRSGDRVALSGPYGTFIGDPSVDTPVLCLGAGTGLAPLLALSESALRRGYRQPVSLLLSARGEADVYGQGLMAWWQARHPSFQAHITLTREKREGYLFGRIQGVLPSLFPDLSGHTLFIAGNPRFVDACMGTALTLGARAERIHTEGFFVQQKPLIPDAEHLLLP
ncbi:2Fe-2S iron-sulfur cluster-binding protein [Zoogloea sp.]|uniref:2Fe-2S iron-sulfur cluster-binding protein n=1 Tax=Zoogloea sp. TaxID=49181 RepID=UPI00260A5C63|nr:2Fe-2S iron-sulfur cluster-binding protein [Zoogloea sp.]MDD3353693.1 2Fe-2S iron-sulfur cluster-binding protein [Zoogloea sp.]